MKRWRPSPKPKAPRHSQECYAALVKRLAERNNAVSVVEPGSDFDLARTALIKQSAFPYCEHEGGEVAVALMELADAMKTIGARDLQIKALTERVRELRAGKAVSDSKEDADA